MFLGSSENDFRKTLKCFMDGEKYFRTAKENSRRQASGRVVFSTQSSKVINK